MNPEIKKLWTDALESGEYKQTRGALQNDTGFCCLGVLCELHRKAVSGPDWKSNPNESFLTYMGDDSGLPTQVQKWAGLELKHPFIKLGAMNILLAYVNDNGTPFSLIAEHIKRQL